MFMSLEIVLILLTAVLAGGSGYSWFQFYKVVKNQCDTCSVGLHQSPFKSKCFTGAVFFTVAFVLSCWALSTMVV